MLIAFLPLLIGGTVIAFADDGAELNENISSIIDSLDLTEIQKYLDEYGNDYVFSFGDTAKEIVTYLVKGNLGVNYTDYISELFSVLFSGVTKLLPAFAQVVRRGGRSNRKNNRKGYTACLRCAHYAYFVVNALRHIFVLG